MKCQDCRFWSETVAQSIGCGPIEALCICEDSPHKMKMTTELNGCQFGKENLYGAIDDPENENTVWKTDFYCEQCEYNSLVAISISTEGFEVTCPQCKWHWWFSTDGTPPNKSLNAGPKS